MFRVLWVGYEPKIFGHNIFDRYDIKSMVIWEHSKFHKKIDSLPDKIYKKNHLANKLMNKPCLFDKFLQNFNLKSFEEFLDFTIFETWKFL